MCRDVCVGHLPTASRRTGIAPQYGQVYSRRSDVLLECPQQEAAQVRDLGQAVALPLHGRNIVRIQALEGCVNLRTLDLSFNMLQRLDG
jgi:hypothetical protein